MASIGMLEEYFCELIRQQNILSNTILANTVRHIDDTIMMTLGIVEMMTLGRINNKV